MAIKSDITKFIMSERVAETSFVIKNLLNIETIFFNSSVFFIAFLRKLELLKFLIDGALPYKTFWFEKWR